MNKRSLGAFYTKNAEQIFERFSNKIINKDVVDPFCGEGDLLNFAHERGARSIVGFDINKDVHPDVIMDSLLNPCHIDGIILTNPPYLARNKAKDKEVFDKWGVNDLYKASLLMLAECSKEGAIVVPQNLFCDEDFSFRKKLFNLIEITDVEWHDSPVFDDTDVRVVSFYYRQGCTSSINGTSLIDGGVGKLRIGKDWWEDVEKGRKLGCIRRLIVGNDYDNPPPLLLRTTDTGGENGRISLNVGEPFYGKVSDRTFATPCIQLKKPVDYIANKFNCILETNRDKYNDRFLTLYMQGSNTLPRRRVAIKDAFALINLINET